LANRRSMVGIVTFSILVCLTSIGLFLLARDGYSEHEIRKLIEPAYSHRRPGGGRLSAASYSSIDTSSLTGSDLGKAQILLLRQPDSPKRRTLQGFLYLAAGEWQEFVQLANSSLLQATNDSNLLNNLGVSLLALSEDNPA